MSLHSLLIVLDYRFPVYFWFYNYIYSLFKERFIFNKGNKWILSNYNNVNSVMFHSSGLDLLIQSVKTTFLVSMDNISYSILNMLKIFLKFHSNSCIL